MLTFRDMYDAAFKAVDRRPTYEWAEDYVTMPSTLAVGGGRKFDKTISPHFNPIFDSLSDLRKRVVVVRKPVRGGGTLISDVWHCDVRSRDPGSAMLIMQDDQMSKDHSEERFMPTLLNNPLVRAMLPLDADKVRNQQILFADGLPLYVTGPAIGKLQSKGIRYMSIDEAWMPKVAAMLDQAEGRLGDYYKQGTSKLLIVSQAGWPDDPFDLRFKSGSQHWFQIVCLDCGHAMITRWQNKRPDGSRWGAVWDKVKDARGDWIVEQAAATARFECEKCGYAHTDSADTRQRWKDLGSYKQLNPNANPEIDSFHWPGLIDWPLKKLVSMFLSAMNQFRVKDSLSLVTFFQKYGPEPKDENTVIDSGDSIVRTEYDKDESGAMKWKDEFVRIMTIDRQMNDVFWVLVCAWSRDGEVRRLHFGQCYSFLECEQVREKHKVQTNHTFPDAGFEAMGENGVYAACARYGWIALNGTDERNGRAKRFSHEETKVIGGRRQKVRVARPYSAITNADPMLGAASKANRTTAKLRHYSGTTMKNTVQSLVESGKWVEDMNAETDMDREFRQQMGAETKKPKLDKFSGRTIDVWVKVRKDNHAFDLAAQQVCAAMVMRILPNPLDLEDAEKEKAAA